MSNPNALLLLADHIKLSLLERQRAKTLNLEGDTTQDGYISRSLDQFRDGLVALEQQRQQLHEAGEQAKADALGDTLTSLRQQSSDLISRFHGFSSSRTSATLTSPNNASLAADFVHAASTSKPVKAVRFSDAAAEAEAQTPSRDRLLPYRDEPETSGYRDTIDGQDLDNEQIHDYHRQMLAEQDAQLDALGASISRQRELSLQIGDELESQVIILDESEQAMDRHQSRLDRARHQVGRISRASGESKQMLAIVILIVILVLLIVVLK